MIKIRLKLAYVWLKCQNLVNFIQKRSKISIKMSKSGKNGYACVNLINCLIYFDHFQSKIDLISNVLDYIWIILDLFWTRIRIKNLIIIQFDYEIFWNYNLSWVNRLSLTTRQLSAIWTKIFRYFRSPMLQYYYSCLLVYLSTCLLRRICLPKLLTIFAKIWATFKNWSKFYFKWFVHGHFFLAAVIHKQPTFLLFLIMGWGLSSSGVKHLVVGLKLIPGAEASARSAAENSSS